VKFTNVVLVAKPSEWPESALSSIGWLKEGAAIGAVGYVTELPNHPDVNGGIEL
jgi:hypothetical protein